MKVDSEALLREAESSEKGEAFQTVIHREGCRVGVGVRSNGGPHIYIEAAIDVCVEGRITVSDLERQLGILRELDGNGFTLTGCGGTVTCEKEIIGDPSPEVERLEKIL